MVEEKREFDVFKLHDSKDSILKLMRAYSVSSKFFRTDACKNQINNSFMKLLQKIDVKLKKELGLQWRLVWKEKLYFNPSKSAMNDWLIGRATIPLSALEVLTEFSCVDEVKQIKKTLTHVCGSRGGPIFVPKQLTSEMAFLVGAILGDGHLGDRTVSFELTDEELIQKITAIANKLFQTDFAHKKRIRLIRPNRKNSFTLYLDSKVITRFFNKFFEIPIGKKSDIIIVPSLIKSSSKEIQEAFLAGIFETDGCETKKEFTITTASEQFCNELYELIKGFGVPVHTSFWLNKVYHKKYYRVHFSKKLVISVSGCTELETRLDLDSRA
ncbi:MAG: LAGLIDADG family homing endonuclease [Candidatus Diapherotrites archaeon]|nr:LAGLIDADG family homing endonuclease [Candidatus Diapherotrites archaeon]